MGAVDWFLFQMRNVARFEITRTSQAARLAMAPASSGEVGTNVGKIRAPALYRSSGNGASYAAISVRAGEFRSERQHRSSTDC